MAKSEMRTKYEVARFVLDGAETERLCAYLEIDEATALSHWHSVAVELGQHLGSVVEVKTLEVPDLFQTRLHDCLVYLLNRIEGEKRREILGDIVLPNRKAAPQNGVVADEAARATEGTASRATTTNRSDTSVKRSDRPSRVDTVLDDMNLAGPASEELIDKRP